jgi:hypothetical protein
MAVLIKIFGEFVVRPAIASVRAAVPFLLIFSAYNRVGEGRWTPEDEPCVFRRAGVQGFSAWSNRIGDRPGDIARDIIA